MNKLTEKQSFSYSSEVGRDLDTIDKTKATIFQHQKICMTNKNEGTENFNETENSDEIVYFVETKNSLSNKKDVLFTKVKPLKNEKSDINFTLKQNDVQLLEVLKTQTEFFYPTPQINLKTKHFIKLKITDVKSFQKKESTDYHYICNLPWRLTAKTECTERTGNVKYFSVYIDCNPDSESTLWSCDAVVKFRLISKKSSDSADFTREFTNKFCYKSKNWGFPTFMEWSQVTNSDYGFVYNDEITVEAQITIEKVIGVRQNPSFDFSINQGPISDGILVINNERLYISKPYLAMYSPVFHAMFYSKFVESEMKEISLKDVVLKEFVELLNVIYPSHSPITTDSVEYLLELGDKFEISYVIEECEKFLCETEDISVMTKLVWADQYCLSVLHDTCMKSFEKVEDFKSLETMEEYESFSDTTKVAFLEKILKLL